jgi:histidinol-phosphate phosphatase family protein
LTKADLDRSDVQSPVTGLVRAVFVDRDGTLNYERPDYVKSPEELRMIPGACEQVAKIARGFPLIIVITNQSVVGRGIISEGVLDDIHRNLKREFLQRSGRTINHIFYCPHRPEDNCDCRKPKIGLFLSAARLYHLDLPKSVLIGDKVTDEEAAKRVGCGYINVKTNTAEITGRITA